MLYEEKIIETIPVGPLGLIPLKDLDVYRRTLKGMNPQVQIVFEDAEGEIEEVTEADLPFDVNAEVIEIPPEAYGIFRQKGNVNTLYQTDFLSVNQL